MTRRFVFLIAAVLACIALALAASLGTAHTTASRPLTCIGLATRGVCLTLS